MITKCRICLQEQDNPVFVVREMMLGLRDTFKYYECNSCGCLQILDFPQDISRYYPANYYSFSSTPSTIQRSTKELFQRRQTLQYVLSQKRFEMLPFLPKWLKFAQVEIDSLILDVGCGNGGMLLNMFDWGFLNLRGIDPFMPKKTEMNGEVVLLKKDISEMNGQFDFIMLHHSFEHMKDPLPKLFELRRLLKDNGEVLIRMPTVSSFAWKAYRENWVQLDAPRHLHLLSISSIHLLADQAKLQVRQIIDDSNAFQFIGSEQYILDIPLFDQRSFTQNMENSLFTNEKIFHYERLARELNTKREGDQICVYLKKNK